MNEETLAKALFALGMCTRARSWKTVEREWNRFHPKVHRHNHRVARRLLRLVALSEMGGEEKP